VTTANAALLAVRLYARTGAKAYLGFAQQAYEWTERCLGRPDGLVADHIDLKGRIDGHTWSYNQGAMVAVGVRLYKATGKRRYLADAERTANRALATIGDPLASREPPVFLAIFFRDLHELTSVVPKRADRAAEEAFADEAWSRARDPRTGLFRFDGRQPTLLDQAAMVQVYAELAS
jgi:predicted alpha-1,6-mannanase (GH76 family)